MENYIAPIKDMCFVLKELADIDGLSQKTNNKDISSDNIKMILEEAGRFASEEIDKINQLGDQEGVRLENGVVRMPKSFIDAYQKFVKNGWFSVIGDKEYGGQNLALASVVAINEIWQATNMSFAVNNMLTQGAIELIEHHGTTLQKSKYLPNLISGSWSGTMNLTEPHAGSDLSSIKTKAYKDGNNFLIKGTKIYITHGDQDMSDNIVHLVLAKLPDAPEGVKGISLFIVPKFYLNEDNKEVRNDIKVVSIEHKLGHNASPTCVLSFGENLGAVGELIGEPNQGLKAMFTMMNNARLNVGVQGLALSERAYQKALSFAKERKQGVSLKSRSTEPVEIIEHPDIKRMLMEMRSQIEAMRGLAVITGKMLDNYKNFPQTKEGKQSLFISNLFTPIVKAWCTDQSVQITSIGIQIHGGMGFIEDTGAAQYFRDSRILPIYEGTNGIQALDLLRRKLFQENGATLKKVYEMLDCTGKKCLDLKGSGDINSIGNLLLEAKIALEKSSEWLITTFMESPEKAASGATPFINMFGWVLGGWVMAQSALKANKILINEKNDKFAIEKINTATFYCNTYLPTASALKSTIITSYKSLKNYT